MALLYEKFKNKIPILCRFQRSRWSFLALYCQSRVLRFMEFRLSIRTPNLIERVFREFLKVYIHNGYISFRKVFTHHDNVLVS